MPNKCATHLQTSFAGRLSRPEMPSSTTKAPTSGHTKHFLAHLVHAVVSRTNPGTTTGVLLMACNRSRERLVGLRCQIQAPRHQHVGTRGLSKIGAFSGPY